MVGLFDLLSGVGIDSLLKSAGLNDSQIVVVKKVKDVISKDLGLSDDLKKEIKKLINKEVTVEKILPLLNKYTPCINKTYDEIVAYLKSL